jgi:hypothetical protein
LVGRDADERQAEVVADALRDLARRARVAILAALGD